jgi:hypothetical protein
MKIPDSVRFGMESDQLRVPGTLKSQANSMPFKIGDGETPFTNGKV